MGANDGLLGASRWNDFEGWESESALDGNCLVVGCPIKANGLRIQDRLLAIPPQRHLLSIAPTRSGKGVSHIIPNLLLYRGSTIVIDPKGENAWITAKYRREGMGHKTIILDPWGEVKRRYGDLAGEQETVARFNPLSILDPASENYADDIASLADALIINQNVKDPHWDDSARELVAGLMAYLVENPKTRPLASLAALRILLTKPSDEVRAIAEDAMTLGAESVAARKLGRFKSETKETAGVISAALTQTAFLDSVILAQNMRESDFSFDDLIDGDTTIYLVLPVDKLQTYGRWLRLLLSIGIRTVARNVKPLPLPVLFMLDEFGTIGRLNAVSQAYGLMAGLQMMIWVFVQDLVQLKRDYQEEWETFVGNSSAVTFMNIMDQFTARYLSELCGVTTVERISERTVQMRERGEGFLGAPQPNYSAMADQLFSRPLISPAEIRCVTRELGIMIWPYQPIDFSPLRYYDEPFFLERARVDPHFPEMVETKKQVAANQEIPNYAAAVAYMNKLGYTVKEKGFFASKIKVFDASGKEYAFDTEEALIQWARQSLAKEKAASNK